MEEEAHPCWQRVTRALSGLLSMVRSSSAILSAAALTRRALLRPILCHTHTQREETKTNSPVLSPKGRKFRGRQARKMKGGREIYRRNTKRESEIAEIRSGNELGENAKDERVSFSVNLSLAILIHSLYNCAA